MTLQDIVQTVYPSADAHWLAEQHALIEIAEDVQRLTPLSNERAFEVAKTVRPYGVEQVTGSPEFGLLPLAIYVDVLNYVFAWRCERDNAKAG